MWKPLLLALAVVLMCTPAADAVILADFDAAGTGDTMQNQVKYISYDDIATATTPTNWSSYRKNATTTPSWDISGGQLINNLMGNQSNNVADAVFKVDLSSPTDGKVWAIQFKVVDGGRDLSSSGLQDFDVLLGQDDGDNTTEDVVKLNGGGQQGQTGVVVGDTWNHVVGDGWIWQEAADGATVTARFHDDYSGGGAQGTLVDLSANDLLSFQVQSNSKAVNQTIIDDVAVVEVDPLGDFDSSTTWTTADIDAMSDLGDLTVGVDVTGTGDDIYDIATYYYNPAVSTPSNTVSSKDLTAWLYWAARADSTYGGGGTAYYTAYKASDNNLDRKVDINDFLSLGGNFTGGAKDTSLVFSDGDTDADDDVDINDFLLLGGDFDGGTGYGAAGDEGEGAISQLLAADPGPGEIDLIVNWGTGEITLDANNATIGGFQIQSPDDGLVSANMAPPKVLAFGIGAPDDGFYAEGTFTDTLVNGLISLGNIYDTGDDFRDLQFSYGLLGGTAGPGDVSYIPEPSSMVLLAFGLMGLAFIGWRRRR